MFFELVNSLLRGFKLRCPCCGHGHLFQTTLRLRTRCEACDERFEREPGQRFGAVYVNLLLTLVLTVVGFTVTQTFTSLSTSQQIWIWTPVAALGPPVFYRLSKGLWISIVFLGEGLYIPWLNR
jgi:uncharacterized protein (DUF983 family)